jgi:hypothetical protein
MSIRSSVDHEENIFLIFFHQVVFPGKFFNLVRIQQQLLRQDRIIPDLIEVELLLLLQRIQFLLMLHTVQDAVAVEKHHPHGKSSNGYRVLVKEKPEDFF